MDLTAEHRGGIRWYNDFSWHAWIEVRNPRPTVECFYGAINITEASILGQRQTWIQQAGLHYEVYFSRKFLFRVWPKQKIGWDAGTGGAKGDTCTGTHNFWHIS